MTSTTDLWFFRAFAAVILFAAGMVVTRRSPIVAALWLALSLLSIAGLYVTLHAEFLFAAQVLVYTGGIMVLFLFVIMLVNVDDLEHLRASVRGWEGKAAFVTAVFLLLVPLGRRAQDLRLLSPRAPEVAGGLVSNTRDVAGALLTGYLLPFEIVSVLLLVAMVGAIVLSKKEI